jgi:hypothetical protein
MSYPLKATIAGILALGAGLALRLWLTPAFFPVHLPWLVGFFMLSSIGLHWAVSKAAAENPRRFTAYYMGLTAIKMMVYLAIIAIYAFLNRPQAIPFTLAFMALYLIYTTLEVIEFLKVGK